MSISVCLPRPPSTRDTEDQSAAPSGRLGGSIRTEPTGQLFYPLDCRADEIHIADIARSLAFQCRWLGYVKWHYSVAQHSVYVSMLCPEAPLWGLLHDASEAYLGDVVRPMKHSGLFGEYRMAEARIMGKVCSKWGLDLLEPAEVKRADNVLLKAENQQLRGPSPASHAHWYAGIDVPDWLVIDRITPDEAEERFLARFRQLTPD